ncbi:DUF2608 domain-containing protein [Candidatus Tisiphia endosymbiont of Thecophora atra]|uniref:DUF2608 domain-containing protein n=1 Tax=Candidatus Tisiphia endosymbiont of Thecophora atra TaxID=3066258 RepID=UPI00312CBC8D
MRKILIILILQFIVIEAFASIERIKLHSFDNLVDQIKNDTIKGKDVLIVFDIDGVILCPKDSYLSHNNREVRHKFLDDIEKSQGLAQRKNIYALIAAQMEYKLIEPSLMKHFWFLKFNGYNVIALTSMGPNNPYFDQEQDRVDMLKDKGLLFDKRYHGQIKIDKQKRPQPKAIEGVIFARGYEKGLVLKAYLDQQHTAYSKIVVIDDKPQNLDSIEKHLKNQIGKIVLVEYSYDKFVEQKFTNNISTLQQNFLKTQSIWLSDKQASVLLQMRNKAKVE